MKKILAGILAAGLFVGTSQAKVSFSLDIELLKDNGDNALSDDGLLVLVVDSDDDGFALPSDGSFGEQVVASWDLASAGPGTSSITLLTKGGVPYGNDWDAGDDLALLWFPNLGDGENPSATEVYGIFSDSLGLSGGDIWEMPVDGTILHSLKFFTDEASELVSMGGLPAGSGDASFSVDNPPSGLIVPTSLIAANSGNSGAVNLTWEPTGGVSPVGGYIIQRQVAGSNPSAWETIGSSSGNSFSDMDFTPGISYDYQVISVEGSFLALSDSMPEIEAQRSVFVNISSRGSLLPGSSNNDWTLLNGGVILAGNDPSKRLMALGIASYHEDKPNPLTGWVDDPRLTYNIFGNGTIIAANDDWTQDPDNPGSVDPDAAAILDTMGAVGSPVFFVDDELGDGYVSKDAALLVDLPTDTPNLFKVRSNNSDGFVGIGLYDAEYEGGPTIHDNRIINLSTRGYLSDGGVFNGGIVIVGNVPKEVLVLASGPRLGAASGTPEGVFLEDPTLSLRALGVGEIATNDDWNDPNEPNSYGNGLLKLETDMARVEAAIAARGFNTANLSLDSAMLVTLEPGQYVFRVFAKAGTQQDGSVQISLNEIEMPN